MNHNSFNGTHLNDFLSQLNIKERDLHSGLTGINLGSDLMQKSGGYADSRLICGTPDDNN
jgi:hypothetical protein